MTDTPRFAVSPEVGSRPAAAHALAIYAAALEAVRADRLVLSALQRDGHRLRVGGEALDLTAFAHLYVVGAGKAAAGMARAVEERLGDVLTEGVVVTKYGHAGESRAGEGASGRADDSELGTRNSALSPDSRLTTHDSRLIRILEAAHPVPDAASVEAGRAIRELAAKAGEDDLALVLLSGGASALMELPQNGLTLEDLRATTDRLLRAGADIEALNAVRACLSQLKAGGLGRALHPARTLVLVLSDVLGNPLNVIASGPCVDTPPDPAAARALLARFGLWDEVPAAVRAALGESRVESRESRVESRKRQSQVASEESRETGLRAEDRGSEGHPTPNTQHSTPGAFSRLTTHDSRLNTHDSAKRLRHVLIGDIRTALEAARDEATRRGLRPCVLTGWVTGEAREVAKVFAGIARDLPQTRAETGLDCFLAGGETTVTVRGGGKGGRSQEIALAAAPLLAGVEHVALLAAGTDGTDGPTDAAGGIADGGTLTRAQSGGQSAELALRENDAYPFLQAAGGLLLTGPTHSNVGDLLIAVTAEA